MKIEIQNLGPIRHFEFDLEKDLHLLYGKNNVGKSFAANILYCLLKAIMETDPLRIRKYFQDPVVVVSELDNPAYAVRNDTWKEEVNKAGKAFFQKIVDDNKRFLGNTYASLDNISGDFGTIKITAQDGKNALSATLDKALEIQQFDFEFSDVNSDKHTAQLLGFRIHNALQTLQNLLWQDVFQVYFLPTSRTGVYLSLSNLGALFAELSTKRNSIQGSFNIPGYSAAISDYYLKLMGQHDAYGKSETQAAGNLIEKNILQGEVFRDDSDKRIYYQPAGDDRRFHITETASMISELAPVVLFLKNVVRPDKDKGKPLLIIEEPEAHLHPEAQIQLMEIFAELTRQNVKVILTSHSDFMLNKVTNMILDNKLEPEKVAVYHMVRDSEKGSVVRGDMVPSEEGIEDHNFMDVSEQLYEERVRILERENQQANALG